jgi:hypothetical protein
MNYKSKGLSMFKSLNNAKALPYLKYSSNDGSLPNSNRAKLIDDDQSDKRASMHTITAISFLSEEKKMLAELKGTLNKIKEKESSFKLLERIRARSISSCDARQHIPADIYKGFKPRCNKRLNDEISKKVPSSGPVSMRSTRLDLRSECTTEAKVRAIKKKPVIRHFIRQLIKEERSPLYITSADFKAYEQKRKLAEIRSLMQCKGVSKPFRIPKFYKMEISEVLGPKPLGSLY